MSNKRYNWSVIQEEYNKPKHTMKTCMEIFGFCNTAWSDAVKHGDIKLKPRGKPIEELLNKNQSSRTNIKRRILKENLLKNECSICGLGPTWQSKKLSLQLDHKNGVRDDNRIENLRLLCPNCHSQTETFGSRNIKK